MNERNTQRISPSAEQVNNTHESDSIVPFLQSTPNWCGKLFFGLLADDKREFCVQVSHRYVYLNGERSRIGPENWPRILGALVQMGCIEVVKREHYYGDGYRVYGKKVPQVAEFFQYRITDTGLSQARAWAQLRLHQRSNDRSEAQS